MYLLLSVFPFFAPNNVADVGGADAIGDRNAEHGFALGVVLTDLDGVLRSQDGIARDVAGFVAVLFGFVAHRTIGVLAVGSLC